MLNNNQTRTFFSDIRPITTVASISEIDRYVDAPADWLVVIADIRDSTGAVDNGLYKQVNMSSGCIITAVLNSVGRLELPFVFGGDGATLLIPPDASSQVREALIRTRKLILDEFLLDMRIGLVPIVEIVRRNVSLKVARLELSPGNNIALFDGGGVELAEAMVRQDTRNKKFSIAFEDSVEPPDLEGLSCRWEPLVSRNGAMLCLIVRPMSDDPVQRADCIKNVLNTITNILGGSLMNNRPVTAENMHFKWPPRGLIAEAKATHGKRFFLTRYLQILSGSFVQLILERFNLKGGNYNAPVYRQELQTNSDYCRFHDVLNVVLDCSKEQINSIELSLENFREHDVLEFGSFTTKQALMTCFVSDLESSQHVHFIDGDDGGFWSASKVMKQRLQQR